MIVNNKKERTCRIAGISVVADHNVKIKESKKKYLSRKLKKTMKYESDGDNSCIWCTRNNS